MNWVAALFIGLGASSFVSCKECESVGCRNGALLNFSPSLSTPGNYEVSGTLDDQAFSCQVMLEDEPTSTCDKAQVHVLFDKYSSSAITGLMIDTNPARVTVEIRLAGQLVAAGEANPGYQRAQPNGDGCEPICNFSEQTINLH